MYVYRCTICTNCLPSRRKGCSNMPGSHNQIDSNTEPSQALGSNDHPSVVLVEPSTPCTDEPVCPQLAPTTVLHSTTNILPAFVPMTDSQFMWGELESSAFASLLDSVYLEVVHWRKNSFSIPRGNSGKAFVNAFAHGSALEHVALKATIVLPLLVLQKPHRKSKAKDHAALLERRLKIWEQGNLAELLNEGKVIQKRFSTYRPPK